MPRPKKYPHLYYVRLSDETDANLEKQAQVMGLAPAVVLRTMAEASLDTGKIPITLPPDPRQVALLKKFVKKFGGEYPAHQNWNEIKSLVEEARALIKGGE